MEKVGGCMKIVFLGDSLTYAFKIRRKDAWTKLIEENTGIECLNRGVNGDTTSGMLARFKTDVIDERPNAVHIMGGGNDMICQADLGFIRTNLMSMVHQAKAKNIEPIIGVGIDIFRDGIAPAWQGLPDYDQIQADMLTHRKWLIEFAKFFGVKLIDYRTLLYDYSGDAGIGELYSDGLHLNEKGNMILAEIFMDEYGKKIK